MFRFVAVKLQNLKKKNILQYTLDWFILAACTMYWNNSIVQPGTVLFKSSMIFFFFSEQVTTKAYIYTRTVYISFHSLAPSVTELSTRLFAMTLESKCELPPLIGNVRSHGGSSVFLSESPKCLMRVGGGLRGGSDGLLAERDAGSCGGG